MSWVLVLKCLKFWLAFLHFLFIHPSVTLDATVRVEKGGSERGPGDHAPQSEVCPPLSPNEIFGESNWTPGTKI